MLNQPIKKCNHTETCIFQNCVVYSVIINVCREESLGSPGQPAPAWAIYSLGPVTRWHPLRPWHFLTPGPRVPTLPAFLHPMFLGEEGRWITSQLTLPSSGHPFSCLFCFLPGHSPRPLLLYLRQEQRFWPIVPLPTSHRSCSSMNGFCMHEAGVGVGTHVNPCL